MRWLPATALFSLPFALASTPFFACSSDDSNVGGGSYLDGSQPPPTKVEAGSACGQDNDCEPGLVCLYPASSTSTCNEFKVCVVQPFPCTQPQLMCSCLAEPIQVCGGYAQNQVDPTGPCDGGVVIIPEAGTDAGTDGAIDATPGADASDASDAAIGVDATDAASE
jgi:hypothetical protein